MANIIELIKEEMKERAITRAELARRLKVSRSEVTQMLQPERNLTISKICEIASALGCTMHLQIK
jgi:transcriptional regulator with XRE-family HTH domain